MYTCVPVVDTWDDLHPPAGKGSSFSAQWEQLACPDTSQGGPWLTNKGTKAGPLPVGITNFMVQFMLQGPLADQDETQLQLRPIPALSFSSSLSPGSLPSA